MRMWKAGTSFHRIHRPPVFSHHAKRRCSVSNDCSVEIAAVRKKWTLETVIRPFGCGLGRPLKSVCDLTKLMSLIYWSVITFIFYNVKNQQESLAVADKPARRESMPKIAPIRRAYNVVADNTGLSQIKSNQIKFIKSRRTKLVTNTAIRVTQDNTMK